MKGIPKETDCIVILLTTDTNAESNNKDLPDDDLDAVLQEQMKIYRQSCREMYSEENSAPTEYTVKRLPRLHFQKMDILVRYRRCSSL